MCFSLVCLYSTAAGEFFFQCACVRVCVIFPFCFRCVQVSDDERAQLEERTRGQTENEHWHVEHCGRITASMVHHVVNLRTSTQPDKLVASIMSYKEKKPLQANDPCSHGRAMEAEARQVYLSVHSKSPLSVKECGLFVDAELGFLGASPNGIIRDEAATDTHGHLDIKCPVGTVSVETLASQDKSFCVV